MVHPIFHLNWFPPFEKLQLDIVGIVAILGEASTSRNAQASALSWHHVLPRLYPAPQALLKHHQDKRLPTEPGVVVGALSGRIRHELNFFIQLMHHEELPEYTVQLLHVSKRKAGESKAPFEVKKTSHLASLSVLGCCMSIVLFWLALWQSDGPAMLAVILLSSTSSFVGLASWSTLDSVPEKPDPKRKNKTPMGDVVIFYPNGSFRVIRCSDEISRLYFKVETCEHYFTDQQYRVMALISTVLLMGGLIMLSNSNPVLQMSFAASYILLNAAYWVSSAVDPAKRIWKTNFNIEEIKIARSVPHSMRLNDMPTDEQLKSVLSDITAMVELDQSYYITGEWQNNVTEKFQKAPTWKMIVRPEDEKPIVESIWKRSVGAINGFIVFALKHTSSTQQKPEQETSTIRAMLNKLLPNQTLGYGAVQLIPHEPAKANLTAALWKAIALTGTSRWARNTNIAPNNAVWNAWLEEAAAKAGARQSSRRGLYNVPPCVLVKLDRKQWIVLPDWDEQARLSELFVQEKKRLHDKFQYSEEYLAIVEELIKLRLNLVVVLAVRIFCRRWKEKMRFRAIMGQLNGRPTSQHAHTPRVQGQNRSATN